MLISKFKGYVLIHLLNLGVPSALCLKTFNWLQVIFKIGTYKVNKDPPLPGGMQASKFIQLVSLSIPYYFRATSVHDMA